VLPVIMVGIIPAVILSFIFAELLAAPVRRIHAAAKRLADGDFSRQFNPHGEGEFAEIGHALNKVSTKLQETLSQAAGENALIAAERGKLHSVLNSMTDGVFALDQSRPHHPVSTKPPANSPAAPSAKSPASSPKKSCPSAPTASSS
jgi:signal transduction histidine kinase